MANNDGQVKIGIALDDKEFDQGLEKVKRKSKTTGTQIKNDIEDVSDEFGKSARVIENNMGDAFEEASKDSGSFKKQTIQDAQKIESEWAKAHKSMQEKQRRTFDDMNKLGAVAIAGIATALGGLALAGIKYNATMEQYVTSFSVMLGDAEKAAKVTEEIKRIAAVTPFEVKDLMSTTQLLLNYGLEVEKAIDMMTILGDIAQGDAVKLNSIALAFGQMSSLGKVTMQDMKQMINSGFNPLQAIAAMTGETLNEVNLRYEQGSVSVDEVTKAMVKSTQEGGKYFQSMEKQSLTLNGRLSTLSDTWNNKLGQATEKFSKTLANDIIPAVTKFVDEFDVEKASQQLDGLLKTGKQLVPVFVAVGAGFAMHTTINYFSGAVLRAKDAMKAFNLAMSTNPLGIVLVGAAALTAGLFALGSQIEKVEHESKVLGKTYQENYDEIMQVVKANESLQASRDEALASNLVEISNVQRLTDELGNLVDANGNVSDANKVRAEFILGELNGALGTEYTMADLISGKYLEMKGNIDELIKSKTANIILDSKREEYIEALDQEAEQLRNLGEQRLAYDEIATQVATQEAERQEILNTLSEKYGDNWRTNAEVIAQQPTEFAFLAQTEAGLRLLNKELNLQNQSLVESQGIYDTTREKIVDFETAMGEMATGNYSAVIETYKSANDSLKRNTDVLDEESQKQQEILGTQFASSLAALEEYAAKYEAGTKGYTEEGLEIARQNAIDSYFEYQKVGGQIVDGAVNGININKYRAVQSVVNMANEMNAAFRNTLQIRSPSKVMENNASEIVEGGVKGIKENKVKLIYEMKDMARAVATVNLMGSRNDSSVVNNTNTSNQTVNQVFNSRGLTSPFEAYRRALKYGN